MPLSWASASTAQHGIVIKGRLDSGAIGCFHIHDSKMRRVADVSSLSYKAAHTAVAHRIASLSSNASNCRTDLSPTGSSLTVLKSHSATSQSCPPDTSRSTPSLAAAAGLAADCLSGDAGLLAGLLRAAGAWCALRRRKCVTGTYATG